MLVFVLLLPFKIKSVVAGWEWVFQHLQRYLRRDVYTAFCHHSTLHLDARYDKSRHVRTTKIIHSLTLKFSASLISYESHDKLNPTADLSIASRPVTEYLNAIHHVNAPKEAPRKKVSLTDPTARWTAAVCGRARFTWSTNYLLDIETSVIVDVEATQAYRKSEVNAARVMIDRTEERFGFRRLRLRSPTGAQDEFLLAATVQNLRKLTRYAPKQSNRPPMSIA